MAYRIEPGEALHSALARVFGEQLAAAEAQLARPPAQVHAAIHDARRAMRRARAVQALLRPALDRPRRQALGASLREAGRCLSPLRDAQSVVEAIEAHLPEAGVVLDERARARLLRSLRQRRDRIVAAGATALDAARTLLSRVAAECAGHFDEFDEADLARGLAAGRRRLDRALAAAITAPQDGDALHRLRQRARVHWLQVELVSAAWPAVLGAHAAEAKRLSQALGDERDLALLEDWLARRRAPLPDGRPPAAIRDDVARLRGRLRERGFRLALRVGSESPARFARRVRVLRAIAAPRTAD